MADFPRSLIEFQRRFPDEQACAAYLAQARWPDGFRCPACEPPIARQGTISVGNAMARTALLHFTEMMRT